MAPTTVSTKLGAPFHSGAPAATLTLDPVDLSQRYEIWFVMTSQELGYLARFQQGGVTGTKWVAGQVWGAGLAARTLQLCSAL